MNYFQLSVIMPYKKWNSASFNGYMHAYLFLSVQHINPVSIPVLECRCRNPSRVPSGEVHLKLAVRLSPVSSAYSDTVRVGCFSR